LELQKIIAKFEWPPCNLSGSVKLKALKQESQFKNNMKIPTSDSLYF